MYFKDLKVSEILFQVIASEYYVVSVILLYSFLIFPIPRSNHGQLFSDRILLSSVISTHVVSR